MNEKYSLLGELILKRNDESERKLDYKKIYDLSKLDLIPDIIPEKKFILLSTIKKILLCTNKYVTICNTKEIIQYIVVAYVIFLAYIFVLSPAYEIFLLTEEKMEKLSDYNFIQKFIHYSISQVIEIIFRIVFNYLRLRKTRKVMIYFAENELNKIRNEFNIDINEFNYDIILNRNKKRNKNNNNINDRIDKDYQYVICYPNVRYYNWDDKILNEKEKKIAILIKTVINLIEENFMMKNSFQTIIILIAYLAFFFCLTIKKLCLFYIIVEFLFLYTKIVSFFLSSKFRKIISVNEQEINRIYIDKGYCIILNSSVISVFKLNPIEYYQGKTSIEIYKYFCEKTNVINSKFSIFTLFYS